jgi:hypothetical protein
MTLGACAPADRFLMYIDPYEFEVLSGQGIDASAIKQSLPKSLRVRFEVSPVMTEEAEALQRFAEVLERSNSGWVYLSSAHPFNPASIIPRYPDVRFFREGYTGQEIAAGTPSNQITLVYDRERANYEAGQAVAALLGDTDFLRQIGVEESSMEKPRVGILVALNSESIRRESAAFLEGFSNLEDRRSIEIKEIGNLTDRVKARRLLDGMRESAVAIVFLKTYVLSGFCLEHLAKNSGVAIVEGPIPNRAYGNTLLLMLVDDFIGAVGQMAEVIDREAAAGQAGRVVAPVQLQWNESYRSAVNNVLEGVNQQGVNQQ